MLSRPQGQALMYILCYLCQGRAVTYFSSGQSRPSVPALQQCSRFISSHRELPVHLELPVFQWHHLPFHFTVVPYHPPCHRPSHSLDLCLLCSRRFHLLGHTLPQQHRQLHHTFRISRYRCRQPLLLQRRQLVLQCLRTL